MTAQDSGEVYATVTWNIDVEDNVGVVSETSSHVNGSQFDLGTTLVTIIVEDAAGNMAMCRFSVIVQGILSFMLYLICFQLPSH